MNCEYNDVEDILANFVEYYEDDQDWTFSIIVINTSVISWKQMGIGIYQGFNDSGLRKFKVSIGNSKMIWINVVKAIHAYPNYANVYKNATRDKEGLLLPASEMT